jgi:hypothetical protein
LALVVLLVIPVFGCSEYEQKTGPEIEFIDYVKQDNLGSNLTSFSYRVAKTTETYKIIVSKVGKEKANEIIDKELKRTIAKFQEQWDSNLAIAHSKHITKLEVNSLYYNGKESPYFKKRRTLQRKIGDSMKELSGQLLTKVVSEAMQNSYAEVQ